MTAGGVPVARRRLGEILLACWPSWPLSVLVAIAGQKRAQLQLQCKCPFDRRCPCLKKRLFPLTPQNGEQNDIPDGGRVG